MKNFQFKMPNEKLNIIAFLGLIAASQSFAGLCADVNQSKFSIKNIKESIFYCIGTNGRGRIIR